MIISIASDHGGFLQKKRIIEYLLSKNIQFNDFGTMAEDSCDYPDFAFKVAESVRDKSSAFGILICNSGIGMCIAANKVKGIRAALLTSMLAAKLAKAHNNANVICFSGRQSKIKIIKMLETFLKTEFEDGRHLRRINKIAEYENKQ